jgi:drug/metabolite transporter superfamily protein YnfA
MHVSIKKMFINATVTRLYAKSSTFGVHRPRSKCHWYGSTLASYGLIYIIKSLFYLLNADRYCEKSWRDKEVIEGLPPTSGKGQ